MDLYCFLIWIQTKLPIQIIIIIRYYRYKYNNL